MTSLPINKVVCGDALSVLKEWPDNSVHCFVTSPPYLGLRDYKVEGTHWPAVRYSPLVGVKPITVYSMQCCLGREPSIEAFVGHLVAILREAKRVLHESGTLWLNMGDTSAGSWGGCSKNPYEMFPIQATNEGSMSLKGRPPQSRPMGLKPKNIMGIPWRLAFALQADGWYLRSENIWSKPNPMPESVKDRPARSHEHIFILAKSKHYYYDHVAVLEDTTGNAHPRGHGVNPKAMINEPGAKQNADFSSALSGGADAEKRNLRSVWSIPTHPYPGAHFATYPPKIPLTATLAATSARGCCAQCLAPYERIVETKSTKKTPSGWDTGKGGHREAIGRYKNADGGRSAAARMVQNTKLAREQTGEHENHFACERETIGWKPTCQCEPGEPIPCRVGDMFMGSGTTAEVACKTGRHFVGSELNPEYVKLIMERIGLFAFATGSEK